MLGTRKSKCKLASVSYSLSCGLCLFLRFLTDLDSFSPSFGDDSLVMRSSRVIRLVMCLFCQAHSNCRAEILEGKPATMQVISHGRRLFLEVLTAPPVEIPLCCASLRRGLGVEPMYSDLLLAIERNR